MIDNNIIYTMLIKTSIILNKFKASIKIQKMIYCHDVSRSWFGDLRCGFWHELSYRNKFLCRVEFATKHEVIFDSNNIEEIKSSVRTYTVRNLAQTEVIN